MPLDMSPKISRDPPTPQALGGFIYIIVAALPWDRLTVRADRLQQTSGCHLSDGERARHSGISELFCCFVHAKNLDLLFQALALCVIDRDTYRRVF